MRALLEALYESANPKYKVMVGKEKKGKRGGFDGPPGKSVKDAFAKFIKKREGELPPRSDISIAKMGADGFWIKADDSEFEEFRSLADSSKYLKSIKFILMRADPLRVDTGFRTSQVKDYGL